ncbi:hypothetical protein C9419_25460 [Paraburkholderia fungorum]|nr:MAG: hypothetical protein DI523_17575 [Paraburkholderia fungorum]QLD53728.1 hypothetical protein C9419_25460 [Paraburkholderia fungorum]
MGVATPGVATPDVVTLDECGVPGVTAPIPSSSRIE